MNFKRIYEILTFDVNQAPFWAFYQVSIAKLVFKMTSLTTSEAAHLARRTGFSALPNQVALLESADSRESAVSLLINQPSSLINLPDWHDMAPPARTSDPDERKQRQMERREMTRELKHWWYQQMPENSSPLQEVMTLFWANHFTSSLRKVKWPPAILNQHLLLREQALGSFRVILQGIIQDPAMLIYLDNATSRKEAPNENFARELLELFTLGEGNYSENDIKELARALTGATVQRQTGNYIFRRSFHDSGEKTIFGQTENFAPNDVASLILEQPQVSAFIADKLWRFFIDDQPVESEVATLASAFIDSDYNIGVLVEALLNLDQFYSAKGQQIKSPMDVLVGTGQLLEIPQIDQRSFIQLSRTMGQDLFDPPNVKGWSGGLSWYSSATIPPREFISEQAALNSNISALPDLELLLATENYGTISNADSTTYLRDILLDPAFQVK